MKHLRYWLLIGTACILPSASQAADWTGNVNALLGIRLLDESLLEQAKVDEQDQFGILIDFRPNDWPINMAIDILQSEADESAFDPFTGLGASIELEFTEVQLGVRKLWDRSRTVRPYIGGGLSYLTADISASVSDPFFSISVTDDDSSFGIWAGGGLYWTLGEAFNVGLDVRHSLNEVSFGDLDVDAGTHAGLLLGYHW